MYQKYKELTFKCEWITDQRASDLDIKELIESSEVVSLVTQV